MSDPVEQLAALQRRVASQHASESTRQASREQFLARAQQQLSARRRRPALALWWALPAAAAALCVLVVVLLRAPALTFTVTGGEPSRDYVSAPARAPAELHFSDASRVLAAPGSRLRVEETTSRGARVLLERGTASVRIVHSGSTAWRFAAGPFEVHVTGTRFDLTWDPTRETCELVLHEGSVEVRGPNGTGPMVVRAGQRFRGDVPGHAVQVLTAESAMPAPGAPGTSALAPPPLASAEPPLGESRPPARAARPEPLRTPNWSGLIGQGKFTEVIRDAEARGVSACLASCSAADLRALSDAARYTGSPALAERTLGAVRQRFPGAEGAEAAFLLGRLHERRGALGLARGFYDTYSREAPNGSFAAEALAGSMRAALKVEGRAGAEPLAREYLRRFPQGVHVSSAREILVAAPK